MSTMKVVSLWMGLFCLLGMGLVFAAAPPARTSDDAAAYHLLKELPVGGEGTQDHLLADGADRRLYVTRQTHTMVFDLDTWKQVGDIPGASVHGIAFGDGRGFITNGKDNTVTIFDLKTQKVLDTVQLKGQHPDNLVFDPASKHVFTMNGTKNSDVIDAATGKLVGNVDLGGGPEFAVADGKGKIFIAMEDDGKVISVDTKTNQVADRWSLEAKEPKALGIDRKTNHLFVGCGGKQLVEIDAASGKVLGSIPIGGGVDDVVFDPATKLVFTANGEGTMTVAREDENGLSLVENVSTKPHAKNMTIDSKTHNAIFPVLQFGPAPAATTENPHPRPVVVPGSFELLIYGH